MSDPHRQLFEYSMLHVTPQDILDFCPSDPGYDDYVCVFSEILSSRSLPTKGCFAISETIELTLFAEPEQELDWTRLRRFRTFTNAVALAMFAGPNDSPCIFVAPQEYQSCLLSDASALQDPELLRLLDALGVHDGE